MNLGRRSRTNHLNRWMRNRRSSELAKLNSKAKLEREEGDSEPISKNCSSLVVCMYIGVYIHLFVCICVSRDRASSQLKRGFCFSVFFF